MRVTPALQLLNKFHVTAVDVGVNLQNTIPSVQK